MFQLYQNPRAATWTDGTGGVVTVLGVWVEPPSDRSAIWYLIGNTDPKSTDSSIQPHWVRSGRISLFVGQGR